jgi:GNAT superfamily N-acetyltransferase
MIKIEHIKHEEIDEICKLANTVFAEFGQSNAGNYIKNATKWDISAKLTVNGITAGFYLFNPGNLSDTIFENKKGIQGVALGLLKEYRNNGYGRMLIDKSYELFRDEYDYIWGMHLAVLNNIDHWKKRRIIMNENEKTSLYFSYTFFNKQ